MIAYHWDATAGRMVRRAPVVIVSEERLMRVGPDQPEREPAVRAMTARAAAASPALPPMAEPSGFSAWITDGVGAQRAKAHRTRVRCFNNHQRVPPATREG